VGFGGALDARLRPGDVLVAGEVRGAGPPAPCHRPEALARELAAELAGTGTRVLLGPLLTSPGVVGGAGRARLAARGARAVDMETAVLAAAAPGHPLAAVRVIVDGPRRPLWSPGTLVRGAAAWRTLARVGPALERWAAAPDGRAGAP
ncbi:phosphorylase family protein, partial [Actinomadura sediminis]